MSKLSELISLSDGRETLIIGLYAGSDLTCKSKYLARSPADQYVIIVNDYQLIDADWNEILKALLINFRADDCTHVNAQLYRSTSLCRMTRNDKKKYCHYKSGQREKN